jgi:hypothetical protein
MNVATKVIKSRLGFIELVRKIRHVSLACKYLEYSRDTFYRYKDSFSKRGKETFWKMSRKKFYSKNRIKAHIEERVVYFAVEYLAFGQIKTSNELKKKAYLFPFAGFVVFCCGMIWKHFKNPKQS